MATRTILHVDMDAFYASVEQLDDPALRGRPVIVGGRPEQRGVVSAASYEARAFGVHSAMPSVTAHRLCPNGVFLPVRMPRYAELSRDIHAVFEHYTPLVEPLSLDEAYLDVTASRRLFGTGEQIGRTIKRRIRDEIGLVASVGVATNKFLAKLASDLDKPDGLVVIPPDEAERLLAPLPVSRLWGVGTATQEALARHGITTIGQLQPIAPEVLATWFGRVGTGLADLAHGRDESPVVPDAEAKSLSAETTFAQDVADVDVLHRWLLDLTDHVARRLRRHRRRARTVQIKIRYGDFRTLTRAQTLAEPTDITDVVWANVRELFDRRIDLSRGAVRLVGVGVSGLGEPGPTQRTLFDTGRHDKLHQVDEAADAIRDKFGDDAVQRGALLPPPDDSR